MKKLLKHKKALSPVVAAIILIAVTVAVSIAVAAWMGALTIGFMGTEELKITGVDFTDTTIDLTVQNTGSTKVLMVEVRVSGQPSYDVPEVDQPLDVGQKNTITVTGLTLKEGNAYNIEVVTTKGNIFTYRASYPL